LFKDTVATTQVSFVLLRKLSVWVNMNSISDSSGYEAD